MIDVEKALRDELDALASATGSPDWDEVLVLAGRARVRARRRRAALAALIAATALVVAVATPLGSTIARGLNDFSTWLTGQPGSPVTESEQRAFDETNARSWLGFPAGTKLRRLIRVIDPESGTTIDLLGFRSGGTLCLRLELSGGIRSTTTSCAPLAELRRAGAPARVIIIDRGFGKGTKRAWYGLEQFRAPAIKVTAGIVADGVRSVIVNDRSGKHTLRAVSDAFLYVASNPDVDQRVRRVWVRIGKRLLPVKFAPALTFLSMTPPTQLSVPGPARVERYVRGGKIGWLERYEPRGRSLDIVPAGMRGRVKRHAIFGRVVVPDPSRRVRVALTLSTSRNGGKVTGLCSWWFDRRGGPSGGCAIRSKLFYEGPITSSFGMISGSDQFATVAGLASDDVTRIVAFLANGQRAAVPLADNVFLIDLPRAQLPARLVAYDTAGRVIGVEPVIRDLGGGASPARGRARLFSKAVSPAGSRVELYVGKSTTGGLCMYVRESRGGRPSGNMVSCSGATWEGPSLTLSAYPSMYPDPPVFLVGRVRADVVKVELRFADGARTTIRPKSGFVLCAIAKTHLEEGSELVAVVGRDEQGKPIGSQRFKPPNR